MKEFSRVGLALGIVAVTSGSSIAQEDKPLGLDGPVSTAVSG
jgi:hypothetical protein